MADYMDDLLSRQGATDDYVAELRSRITTLRGMAPGTSDNEEEATQGDTYQAAREEIAGEGSARETLATQPRASAVPTTPVPPSSLRSGETRNISFTMAVH